ncbi:MAG: tRNA 2-thiouridine(34) synthase MnmA, partial [Gemmataceae bacterium]
ESGGNMARVVLAMSGGVDSSVAAYLLKQAGHEVIGLFMRTGVHQPEPVSCSTDSHKKGCCSALDAGDARRVADLLDMPFYALDFEGEFERIIDYFADEYLAGRTPNPCVVCNNWLKFGKLWSYGKQLDADFVATGHYAQIIENKARFEMHRGIDAGKDQSYVLFGLRRSLLEHILFPIGNRHKDEIRDLARKVGLGVHDKPDSVEICFVPDGDHGRVIRERRPGQARAGHIVDTTGNILAPHEGIENFTIGQRKGLGFAAGRRRYVLDIVPATGAVVVGDKEELLSDRLQGTDVNWLIDPPGGPLRCQAKIRYKHPAAAATVTPLESKRVAVQFDEPQTAITPGQAVVFYDQTRVLGGAWIL